MDRITRFSLKNSAVIVMATLMVTAGGFWSATQLKKETMPDVTIPIVAIVTPYPGAAPADVHAKITEPIEKAISSVEGLKTVQSSSSDSVSIVVAEFGYSADMDQAESDLIDMIDMVDFPETALDYSTTRVSMGSQPILRFAIASGGSAEELKSTVQDTVVPALEAVDGVGEVTVTDDDEDTVKLTFDPDALSEYGLQVSDVTQQLQAANLSFPVGSVEVDKIENPIRVSGEIPSIEALEELQIVIYPNANEMFADAFAAMGEGMGQLGGAVGQLGTGMGQLGSAVGQLGVGVGELGGAVGELGTGMGEMAEGMGTQIGLTAALQDVQFQLLDAKNQLTNTNILIDQLESQGATATPEYMQAVAVATAYEEQVIPGLTAASDQIKDQMAAVQPSSTGGGTTAPPTMPSAPSAPTMPSAPSGGSMSAPDMEMGEMTLEFVALGDLADISYAEDADKLYSRADGQPAVLINVAKTQDANTVDTSDGVKEALDEIAADLPEGSEVTYTYDGAVQIEESIADMFREGLLGALFAFIVILIALRNWRSTLISAVSIPLSVVIALLFMKLLGVTMNIMTLGGLTVAIGRVVDDSIVVIENIFHHLQAGAERTPEMIRAATSEVSGAITSSTITTIAVFAPMAFVSGIVGKIFMPFALTVAVALSASLLVAVTVVPLLGKWALLGAKVHPRDERQTASGKMYTRSLEWSLDRKGIVLSAAALLFIGSLALVPSVGMGFMSSMSEPYAQMDIAYPAGYSADEVDDALASLEGELADDPDVVFYTTSVSAGGGFSMLEGGAQSTNKGTVFVGFDPETDMETAIPRMREIAAPLIAEGADVKVGETSSMGASTSSVDMVVTGPDIDSIAEATKQIAAAMESVDGLENVTSNLSETRPQISVEVDQAAAASYGLNAAMVAGTVRGYVAEQSAGFIDLDGRDTEVVYITRLDDVNSAADIANRTLTSPLGDDVRIGDIATVESVETAVSVLTRDGAEYASVSGAITQRDSATVITAVEDEIAKLDLPEGIEVASEGVASMMNESFQQLALAMVIAVFAVYLVMVLAFGEAIAPLAIMFSLPLAVIGGIVGLFLAGMPIDMPAMIGALMLIGLVTTNAIMFIERVNQKLAEGFDRREALLEAGANRVRPILMTALTTIMALIPMGIGLGGGVMSSQSLAIIVMGGLTTSTALTLIVVPVVYDLLEAQKERLLGYLQGDRTTVDAEV